MRFLANFIYLLFYFVIAAPWSIYAQTKVSSATTVAEKLAAHTDGHTIEKVYLQFDKPCYATGDTIYFKGYVTIGSAHKLSALSGVLHVDLIGPKNQILRDIKLPVTAGTAHGDFVLADTLKGGSYRVRAYTNWMRNNGDDSFFEQTIPVGSLEAKRIPESGAAAKIAVSTKLQQKAVIQFMPEGGNLINGNYSKIAFKAITPDGLGTAVNGTVTDNLGTTIVTFASTHLGIGSFTVVPQSGMTYTATVTYADGTTNTVALPKAVNSGYTMYLNNTAADTLRIRISAGLENSLTQVSLVAQSNGELFYASENQSDNKFFTAVIPKSKFPTGIVQFTLFSPNGEPLNERLAFINNHDALKLNLQTEGQTYSPRQKVKIYLDAKDKNNRAATGSFSVAVTDESKVLPDTVNEQSILSNLLLTSDLKGTIEQPNYYFTNNDEKTGIDLDNLLLTQGYRHFEWKAVLNDKQAEARYQPEKSIQISGSVKKNNKPVPDAKVTLLSKSGGLFTLDTLTDRGGKFVFKDLVFADSTKFVVQSKVGKGQDNVTLELDTVMMPEISIKNESYITGQQQTAVSIYVTSEKQFYQEQQKYGINQHAIVLKEVKVKNKFAPPIPHSANLNGSGRADQVLTVKDLEKFTCGKLTDCLHGLLTGILVKEDGLLNVRYHNYLAIVIDGNFVSYGDFIKLEWEDIEGIELITGPGYGAIYGTKMAYGGLLVTTKRGRKTANYYRDAPGVVTYQPQGFYKAREFYAPQYDNPKTNAKITDLRSTIFWNPDIITDKDGKASFSFFNADGKGTYRVVVEGIDADGNLGRQVFRYKVE